MEDLPHLDLVQIEGSEPGRRFRLEGHDAFLIGRAPQAHLRIADDRRISRHHCLIELAPPRCEIRDLGSSNGTYLNEHKISGAALGHGDRVRLGRTVLKVIFGEVLLDLAAAGVADLASTVIAASQPETSITASESVRTCSLCLLPLESNDLARAGAGEKLVCSRCAKSKAGGGGQLPGFRLVRKLGAGGQGVVYLALREETQERVAVKVLRPESFNDARTIKGFLREMEIHDRLRHPRLVTFVERGEHRGLVYMVMEYLPGVDAQAYLKREGGRLDAHRSCTIIVQALEGLAYAHEQGVVHRDFKPANILVLEQQGRLDARLMDFGLAKGLNQAGSLSLSGDVKGTLAFMPPDQILQCRDPRPQFDVFSAGASLYHLLSGQRVWNFQKGRDPVATILEDQPIPLRQHAADVPRALEAVVMKAVAREPDQRYDDAGAFLQALES